MGRQQLLLTGEQNLHLKPFRWMKKARGGHEKLKSFGREMKDTVMSGNGRGRPQAHPWILCGGLRAGKAPSLHPTTPWQEVDPELRKGL